MPTTKTTLIYYRVSTDEQAKHGVSLEHQEKACTTHATSLSISVTKAFHDDGVSAKTTDRPGLQAMLKYCMQHSKEIDYVIVYKIDRLSRNTNDYTNILVLLNKLGIKLLSVTEAIDETPAGKFIGNVMAANAQLDNDIKSERVTACMLTKVEQGYWCWKAPLGYLNATDELKHHVIVLDKQRAALITWAYEKFAIGAYLLEDIRHLVNQKGLRTWSGKEISPQLMYKMMTNKFYVGIMTVNGKDYEGKHDHLVGDETFYKCQQLLNRTDKSDNMAKSRTDEDFPLRHFVLCGLCGRPLTAAFSTGKCGGKFPYYRCYNKACTAKKSISKDILETEFEACLEQIRTKERFAKGFKAVILDVWEKNYKAINVDRKKIEQRLEQLQQEKLQLIEMKKKELLDDGDFKEAFDVVKTNTAHQQVMLEETQIEEFKIDEAVDYVFDVLIRLPKVWKNANYTQQLQLQSLIFPQKPIYQYNGFETPEISPILALNQLVNKGHKSVVAPRGIEPRF